MTKFYQGISKKQMEQQVRIQIKVGSPQIIMGASLPRTFFDYVFAQT